MQGHLILAFIAMTSTSVAAHAGQVVKRPACSKPDSNQPATRQQRQQNQTAQQRGRTSECEASRSIPPVVDPTPIYLL